jgi:hypothetical protein
MTLLITVFVLVFITELVSWVGQTVLVDIVRVHAGQRVRFADTFPTADAE